ncbi:MAG: hypothetical protein GY926_17730 [bacterium]|nr:hypothetical protein [bacterium]
MLTKRRPVLKLRLSILVLSVVGVAACTGDTSSSTTASVGVSRPTSSVASDSTVDDEEVAQPPPLVVVAGEERMTVPGYDYCWEEPEAGQGVCADWFGTEDPTHIGVDTPEVNLQWIDDATLTADVLIDGGRCPLAMENVGEGQWYMAMPEQPGTYRVDVYGESSQGSTHFAVEVSTSVEGPASVPVATVWWPDTSNGFEPYASTVGPRSGLEARLLVVSSDGISNEFPMEALFHIEEGNPIECGTLFGMVHQDEQITFAYDKDTLGERPYEITLTVGVNSPEFEQIWIWPTDLDSEDTLVGPMHPTAGEPWNPHQDTDPLIDTES